MCSVVISMVYSFPKETDMRRYFGLYLLTSMLLIVCVSSLGLAQENASNERAIDELEKAAAEGDVKAMLYLGDIYGHGVGIAKDITKAETWYKRAAERGNAMAMFSLGEMYLLGNGIKVDAQKAEAWFEKIADTGDTDLMLFIARIYHYGFFTDSLSLSKDWTKAREWYAKVIAENQGHTFYEARNALIALDEEEARLEEAKKWYYMVLLIAGIVIVGYVFSFRRRRT